MIGFMIMMKLKMERIISLINGIYVFQFIQLLFSYHNHRIKHRQKLEEMMKEMLVELLEIILIYQLR
jgi:hypothetical protein